MTVLYCPHCGKEIEQNASLLFCPHCGGRISGKTMLRVSKKKKKEKLLFSRNVRPYSDEMPSSDEKYPEEIFYTLEAIKDM